MRLFLSSENLGNYPKVFVDLAGGNKLCYIGNAKDYLDPKVRTDKTSEHRQQFEELGFMFTELDLRKHFDLALTNEFLEDFDVVWCAGGNTFLLRAALKLSGADAVLTNLVKENKIAFGGSSAGAIVAGPTLHGTELGDNPEEVSRVYGSDIVWEGLGLVDFVVIPHWQSEWFGDDAKRMKRALALESANISHITLHDGQVVCVRNDTKEVLK